MKALITLSAVLAMLAASSAHAAQKCFYTDPNSSKDLVEFTSDAPVEVIKGTTGKVQGKVCYDEKFVFDAKHPFEATFHVDLASVDTGIPLRNEHMRDNFLETGKYPKASFKATSLSASAKPPFKAGQKVKIKSLGNFTVHGKSVQKTIPLDVTYLPQSAATKARFKSGNVIRIQGKFPVKLAEHNIKRPEAVTVKLAETVFVTLDMFATDDPAALKK